MESRLKIKIFSSSERSDKSELESKVDKWLEENHEKIEIKNIFQSASRDCFTITFFYV